MEAMNSEMLKPLCSEMQKENLNGLEGPIRNRMSVRFLRARVRIDWRGFISEI